MWNQAANYTQKCNKKCTCNILLKRLWHSWGVWCSSRCLHETRTLVTKSWTRQTPLISEQFPPPISFWCSFCFSVQCITFKGSFKVNVTNGYGSRLWKSLQIQSDGAVPSVVVGGQCSSVSNDSSVTWPQDKRKKVLKIMQLFEERLCQLVRSFKSMMWLRPSIETNRYYMTTRRSWEFQYELDSCEGKVEVRARPSWFWVVPSSGCIAKHPCQRQRFLFSYVKGA